MINSHAADEKEIEEALELARAVVSKYNPSISLIARALLALAKRNEELENGIYCEACGSCGETGCCHVQKCKYMNAHQGDYDDLLKDNDKLRTENAALVARCAQMEKALTDVRSELHHDIGNVDTNWCIGEICKALSQPEAVAALRELVRAAESVYAGVANFPEHCLDPDEKSLGEALHRVREAGLI